MEPRPQNIGDHRCRAMLVGRQVVIVDPSIMVGFDRSRQVPAMAVSTSNTLHHSAIPAVTLALTTLELVSVVRGFEPRPPRQPHDHGAVPPIRCGTSGMESSGGSDPLIERPSRHGIGVDGPRRANFPPGLGAYVRGDGGAPVDREPRGSLFGRFGATSCARPPGWLTLSNSATPRSTPAVRTSMSLELS